jgi:hypothetical protein
MPDCATFRAEVERLRALFADQNEICRRIEDPLEARICRQIRAAIAAQVERAEAALANCEAGLPQPGIHRAEGRVSFLRVHDSGGYGPENDHLDAEVIFKLDTHPDQAFGFQLRDNGGRPAHEGMLMLLRDAMAHDFDVATDYRQQLNRANSVAFRIELTNPSADADSLLVPFVVRR